MQWKVSKTAKPPIMARSAKLCCGAKLRLRRAGSRFAKPRSSLRKERFSYFSRVRKVPKVHQRFANLWTPGTIQSSAGSDFAEAFRRILSKPVLPAKRRRKGFESVRKGYRSADARLIFFENGLLYCKLTVASDIQKGLLHVSFGAVGSWSFGVLNRGLQNLGTFQKDLIWFVRMYYLCALLRDLRNLGAFLQRF